MDTRFYIASLSPDKAVSIAGYIRSHWAIENQLHWHLDMAYGEDFERTRTAFGPENLMLLHRLATNAIRTYERTHDQKRVLFRAHFDTDLVEELLLAFFGHPEKTPFQTPQFA